MKIKTSELEGAALDWSVAKACGVGVALDVEFGAPTGVVRLAGSANLWRPSTDWGQGGPLIEKQIKAGFEIAPINAGKVACSNYTDEGIPYSGNWDTPEIREHGDTPLIAACRAIVAAKLGDTVDIPEELL